MDNSVFNKIMCSNHDAFDNSYSQKAIENNRYSQEITVFHNK